MKKLTYNFRTCLGSLNFLDFLSLKEIHEQFSVHL